MAAAISSGRAMRPSGMFAACLARTAVASSGELTWASIGGVSSWSRRDRVRANAAILQFHRPGTCEERSAAERRRRCGQEIRATPRWYCCQDDRRAIAQMGQKLLNCEKDAACVDVEVVIEAVNGDVRQLHAVDGADIGNDDIQFMPVACDLRVEAIEVFEAAHIALYGAHAPPGRCSGFVQAFLIAAEYVDIGTFSAAKPLSCCEPNALLLPPVMTATFVSSRDMNSSVR